MARVSQK